MSSFSVGPADDGMVADKDDKDLSAMPDDLQEVEDDADDDLFGGSQDEGAEETKSNADVHRGNEPGRSGEATHTSSSPSSANFVAAENVVVRSPPSQSASISEGEEGGADLMALEHRETSGEPPMGYKTGEFYDPRQQQAQEELKEASFSLPSLPLRRGASHYFVRLPNLLQYKPEVFEEVDFEENLEDEGLRGKEGFSIDDAGLRSLLATNNTIRWRWYREKATQQEKLMQSNGRIVRWSDGSSSLQLGKEFYDVQETRERGASSTSMASSPFYKTTASPSQYLTHMFVKHDGQEALDMYQTEAPILANMSLRPTSNASDSHQRLARAVRHQRGTLVKEAQLGMDPELEKERKEREDKKQMQRRARELKKRRLGAGGEGGVAEDADDDAFWANVSRTRRMGAEVPTTAGARLSSGGKIINSAFSRAKQTIEEAVEGIDDVSSLRSLPSASLICLHMEEADLLNGIVSGRVRGR